MKLDLRQTGISTLFDAVIIRQGVLHEGAPTGFTDRAAVIGAFSINPTPCAVETESELARIG